MADAENPSAFPFVTLEKTAGSSAIYTQATPGMDLRDWFAGQALAGTIAPYRLSFENAETLTGRFLVARLDYAGDFNGERNYTVQLESSGEVTAS